MRRAIFGLVFVGVGIGLTIWGNGILQNAKESTKWPTTDGRILSSRVTESRSTTGTRRNRRPKYTYGAEVRYEYTVKERKHTSNKVSFGQYSSSNPGHAESIVRRYPQGKAVKVFYNPDNPSTATLEAGASWSSYAILIGGVVFCFAGLLLIVSPLFPRRY